PSCTQRLLGLPRRSRASTTIASRTIIMAPACEGTPDTITHARAPGRPGVTRAGRVTTARSCKRRASRHNPATTLLRARLHRPWAARRARPAMSRPARMSTTCRALRHLLCSPRHRALGRATAGRADAAVAVRPARARPGRAETGWTARQATATARAADRATPDREAERRRAEADTPRVGLFAGPSPHRRRNRTSLDGDPVPLSVGSAQLEPTESGTGGRKR